MLRPFTLFSLLSLLTLSPSPSRLVAQHRGDPPSRIGTWNRTFTSDTLHCYRHADGREVRCGVQTPGPGSRHGVEGRAVATWWSAVTAAQKRVVTDRVLSSAYCAVELDSGWVPALYFQYVTKGTDARDVTHTLVGLPLAAEAWVLHFTRFPSLPPGLREEERAFVRGLCAFLSPAVFPSWTAETGRPVSTLDHRTADSLYRRSLDESQPERKRLLRIDAMNRAPSSPLADAVRGYLVLTKDDVLAEYHFTKAMERGLRDWSLAHNRGVAREGQGRLWDAIADFSQALTWDSSRHVTWAERGTAWMGLREPTCAIEDLTQAILRESGRWEYRLLRARACADAGREEDAVRDYTVLLGIAPHSRREDVYEALLPLMLRFGMRDSARHVAQAAMVAFPRNPRFPALRAGCRWLQGDRVGGEEDFALALNLAPGYEAVYRSRAELRFSSGQWEGAEADLDWLLHRHPADTELLAQRGRIRLTQGREAGALEDFAAAVQADSTNIGAEYYRASLLIRLGRAEEAAPSLVRLIDHPLLHGKALVLRGLAAMQLQRWEDALRDLTAAIAAEPGNAGAWKARAEVYRALQLPDESQRDEEKAREVEAGRPAP